VENCGAKKVKTMEKATFTDVPLYKPVLDRCGMNSVLDKLLQMQEDNLRSELPRVIEQLSTAIAPVEEQLKRLPLPPKNQSELKSRVAGIGAGLESSFEVASGKTALSDRRTKLKEDLQQPVQNMGKDELLQLLHQHAQPAQGTRDTICTPSHCHTALAFTLILHVSRCVW
jgi:hypothetical protein